MPMMWRAISAKPYLKGASQPPAGSAPSGAGAAKAVEKPKAPATKTPANKETGVGKYPPALTKAGRCRLTLAVHASSLFKLDFRTWSDSRPFWRMGC